MNRRGFLGIVAAAVVAPFVPLPIAAAPESGVDLSAGTDVTAFTLQRGDIITIEGYRGEFVVAEVHLDTLTVTAWPPPYPRNGLDFTRIPMELVTPLRVGETVFDSSRRGVVGVLTRDWFRIDGQLVSQHRTA